LPPLGRGTKLRNPLLGQTKTQNARRDRASFPARARSPATTPPALRFRALVFDQSRHGQHGGKAFEICKHDFDRPFPLPRSRLTVLVREKEDPQPNRSGRGVMTSPSDNYEQSPPVFRVPFKEARNFLLER
jgi:hypothetical protein